VRNEEEWVCSLYVYSRCNILISGKSIKEMPGSVASGTHCIYHTGLLTACSQAISKPEFGVKDVAGAT